MPEMSRPKMIPIREAKTAVMNIKGSGFPPRTLKTKVVEPIESIAKV